MSKITFKNYLGQGTMTTMATAASAFETGSLVTISAQNAVSAIGSDTVNNIFVVAEPVAISATPAKFVGYPVVQRDTLEGFLATAKVEGEGESAIGQKLVVSNNEFVLNGSGTTFYVSDINTAKVYPVAYDADDSKTYVSMTVVAGGDDLAIGDRFDIDEDNKVEKVATGAYKAVAAYAATAGTTVKAAKFLQSVNAKVLV